MPHPGLALLALAELVSPPPKTTAAPIELSTPPLPLAPRPDVPRAPRRGTPEILYINFDGAVLQAGCGNDSRYDCSTLAGLFDGYVGPFTGNLNQRMAILQATRKAVADFGIRVVVDRPPDDQDYTMVLYGDLGQQSFAGVAPYIDCGDVHPRDTSFSQGFPGSNTGSTVILQEAAHTWGLEHVDSEFDILNPFKAAGNHQSFLDQCLPIVANTELEPTAGSCNQIHTMFCEAGFQNSYREMLYLFGPTVPDVQPPTLDLYYPVDGDTFIFPVDLPLLGDIEDDLHPQFYSIQIFHGEDLVYDDYGVELNLALTRPPPGDYDLRVRIVDEGGNAAEDRVRFTILPEGSTLPEDDQPMEPAGEDGCRIAARPSTWWLLVIAWRRRRT